MKHSIGLNWLRRVDRHLPTPTLMVVGAIEGVGGFYVRPDPVDDIYNGILIPASAKGTIVCCQYDDREWDASATSAHEWRHHYQYWNGKQYEYPAEEPEEEETYEEKIVRYFGTSWSEYDALRFERRVAPCRENIWRKANVDQYQQTGLLLEF